MPPAVTPQCHNSPRHTGNDADRPGISAPCKIRARQRPPRGHRTEIAITSGDPREDHPSRGSMGRAWVPMLRMVAVSWLSPNASATHTRFEFRLAGRAVKDGSSALQLVAA